ncbi:hypothetical protein XENOCAPTIV_015490 [Xenoophorus captivus]|uniref:Uncharacterized protein n=1 Tax=Xenoophorus captivus TaxID=1517983 RepID=A0ABV0RSN0_9TELE
MVMIYSLRYKRSAAGTLDADICGTRNTSHPGLASYFTSGMRKSPDVSPRRLSDISPQLRQLKYLVVDEAIKEDLKSSRSVEDINSASIEERIMRITGYYGYQPWSTSYKSESLNLDLLICLIS